MNPKNAGPNNLGGITREMQINRVLEKHPDHLFVEVDINGYPRRMEIPNEELEYPRAILQGMENLVEDVPDDYAYREGLIRD